MKTFINLAIASSLTIFSSPWVVAHAEPQGDGVVTLAGVVIDSACGLEGASVDQTVELGSEPIGRLLRDGEGQAQTFQLRLINCSLTRPDPSRPGVNLPDWEHVRVTFDGASDMDGHTFATFGASQGVAFHLEDAAGEACAPGKPMGLYPLTEGDMTLNYTVRLVGNGVPMLAGDHTAAVRFKLEYF